MRLGHVALHVADLGASIDFYSRLLGLKIADTYYMGDEANRIAAFLRCGLGDAFTDHHTIAIGANSPSPASTTSRSKCSTGTT